MRRSRKDAIIGGVLIPVILAIGISVAWLSGQGILPFDPDLTIFLTIGGVIVVLCFASATLASTRVLSRQPKISFADSINRVIQDESTGKEYITSGTHDMTVREALLLDWPFKGRSPSKEWDAFDDRGNTVTDTRLIDFEGIITVRFRDE
jgi:hypothetical protein